MPRVITTEIHFEHEGKQYKALFNFNKPRASGIVKIDDTGDPVILMMSATTAEVERDLLTLYGFGEEEMPSYRQI